MTTRTDAPCITRCAWDFAWPESALDGLMGLLAGVPARVEQTTGTCAAFVALGVLILLAPLFIALSLLLFLVRLPFLLIGLIPWAFTGFDRFEAFTAWYAPLVVPGREAAYTLLSYLIALPYLLTAYCCDTCWGEIRGALREMKFQRLVPLFAIRSTIMT